MIKLALKYWIRHFNHLVSILLSLVVCICGLMSVVACVRVNNQHEFDFYLSSFGAYNYVLKNVEEATLDRIDLEGLFEKSGSIFAGGECESSLGSRYYMGSVDEMGEELFHLFCIEGTYPRHKYEIAASRGVLEGLGGSARVGSQILLNIYADNGDLVEKKSFVVSGIVETLKNERPLNIGEKASMPSVFVFEDYFKSKIKGEKNILAREKKDVSSEMINGILTKNKIEFDDIPYYYTAEMLMLKNDTDALEPMNYDGMQKNMEASHKGFETEVIIPALCLCIGLILFLTVYTGMYRIIMDRKKVYNIYDLMGMQGKRIVRCIITETTVIIIMGVILGYTIGMICSKYITNELVSQYGISELVKELTVDPNVVSLGVCGISMILAVIKSFLSSRIKREKRPKKMKGNMLTRIAFQDGASSFFIIISLLILIGCLFFGVLYMMEKTRLEKEDINNYITDKGVGEYDFLVEKNFEKSNIAVAQLNRHFGGIPSYVISSLKRINGVVDVRSCIQIKSTKIVESTSNKRIRNLLHDVWMRGLDVARGEGYELFEKSIGCQGYKENEELYNVATVCVDDDMLKMLHEYICEGDINTPEIKSGKEVIIVIDGENENDSNPYKVGDRITISDVVIREKNIEEFDFSRGDLPKNLSPSFKYNAFGNEEDGYSFGKRVDLKVKIGAIVRLNDYEYKSFYLSDSLCGDVGFNFLTSTKAPVVWGLPDKNATLVSVKADKSKLDDEMLTQWNRCINSCRDVVIENILDIEKESKEVENRNLNSSIVLFILLFVCGMLGVLNTLKRELIIHKYDLGTLFILGLKTWKMRALYIRYILNCAAKSTCIAWIPVWIFVQERNRLTTNSDSMISLDTAWSKGFPIHFDFERYNLKLLYAFVILFTMIIIITGAVFIARKNTRFH